MFVVCWGFFFVVFFLTSLSATYASALISSVLGCREQLEELEPGTEHICAVVSAARLGGRRGFL